MSPSTSQSILLKMQRFRYIPGFTERLSNLTLAEVVENLRQPQGRQEEEEGSGKGNFAMSKNTSRLFWKNTSLLFCKNSSLIFCKNTSWLFRLRRCLTRPLGTTQPLLWWSNSWQWEGDPIRWDDGLALQGSRRWNSEKQTTATWVKAFAVKFGSHCKASTQQSSLNIPSFAIKKCRLEYCIILTSSKGFLKGILILHWYYSWYLVGRFLLCESQFAVFSSLPGNPFSSFYLSKSFSN